MKGDGNPARLDFDLAKFMGVMEASEALKAFVLVIKNARPELFVKYEGNNLNMVVAFLRSMKEMPKHERRALLRELARTLIISRNRGQSFDDADLDTAMQIAYSKVKDEDA